MARNDERPLMGAWMTTALVVGGMIGAGIFLLPVSLAPFGPNAVLAWVVSGIGAVSLAFALARLAAQDGLGIQAYVERELGPLVGFLVTWAFWVSVWIGNAAMAIASASGLARIFPALGGDLIVPVAMGLLALLLAINAFGVKATGRTAVLTTLIKLLPLVMVVVLLLALLVAGGGELQPLAPMAISFDAVAAASALTLYALLGFETATAPVGKVRDPARTIPRAILGGTAFVALLYLVSSSAVLLLLPAAEVAKSTAPFADAVAGQWGEGPALLAAFGMAVGAFGALNGGVMIAGELGFSMGLRGDLPRFFGKTDRHGTAIPSQLAAGALTLVLVLLNADRGTAGLVTFLFLLTSSATLYLYLAGCAAALTRGVGTRGKLVILVGVLFTAFAFYGIGLEANGWGLVLLGAGVAIRTALRRSSPAAVPEDELRAPAA